MGVALTVGMLTLSNLLMTLAWYWHLRGGVKSGCGGLGTLLPIILVSWGIAFFEYCIVVPANRIGMANGLSVPQLKIIQEVITVCVFIPFAVFFMGEKWSWNYLWAFLCMVGAVYFVNRSGL
ncbi:MAG: DMT family protein [Kiritimatiellia bacterium]